MIDLEKLIFIDLLRKHPKLIAIFTSSAIATLIGIGVRTIFLCLGIDLLNFRA